MNEQGNDKEIYRAVISPGSFRFAIFSGPQAREKSNEWDGKMERELGERGEEK